MFNECAVSLIVIGAKLTNPCVYRVIQVSSSMRTWTGAEEATTTVATAGGAADEVAVEQVLWLELRWPFEGIVVGWWSEWRTGSCGCS